MYLWNYLKQTNKPILVYGVGNGAEKLLVCCGNYGVEISGIFASDDRAGKQIFHGFEVKTLNDYLASYPDPIILLAFGSEREDVIEHILDLNLKFELYAPDLPISDGEIIDDEFVNKNSSDIAKARMLLSDEQSQRVFDNLLKYKHSGKINYLVEAESNSSEKRSLINLGNEAHFLDLGAYTGDTIDEFIDWTNGKYSKITALEPNKRNYKKLLLNVDDKENIECLNFASWYKEECLNFMGKEGRNCGIVTDVPGKKSSIKSVEAIPVDRLKISPDFVKMDVEGAERETLEGLKETLNRSHPYLQISVYHRTDDFIYIPLLLETLCPGYKMYLRHHKALPAWEIQLYCVFER